MAGKSVRRAELAEKEAFSVKLVMIGDPAVGKTSIVRRYLGRGFPESYDPTVGASFYSKNETYNFDDEVILFRFILWDIGGQPTFKEVRPLYYQGARAAIAVYDITRPETFSNVEYWIREFHKNVDEQRPLVVVGNKIDLRSLVDESVPRSRVEKLTEKLEQDFSFEVKHIQTSAKENERLDECFETLALIFYNYISQEE